MDTKIHFIYNYSLLGGNMKEIPIDGDKINEILAQLKKSPFLQKIEMAQNLKIETCGICDGQPDCEICIPDEPHISGFTTKRLRFWHIWKLNKIAQRAIKDSR